MNVQADNELESKAESIRNAARFGDIDDIKLILENSSVDKDKVLLSSDELSGNTALHLSGANGHVDIVKYLITCGADVDGKNKSGSTPLHYASLTGNLQVVKTLLKEGKAKPCVENEFKKTAMDEAIAGKHEEIITFLREFINSQNKDNKNIIEES